MNAETVLQFVLRLLPSLVVLLLGFVAANDPKTRERWAQLLYLVGSMRADAADEMQAKRSVRWPFFVMAALLLIWPIRYWLHATRTVPVNAALLQQRPLASPTPAPETIVTATPTPAGLLVPTPVPPPGMAAAPAAPPAPGVPAPGTATAPGTVAAPPGAPGTAPDLRAGARPTVAPAAPPVAAPPQAAPQQTAPGQMPPPQTAPPTNTVPQAPPPTLPPPATP